MKPLISPNSKSGLIRFDRVATALDFAQDELHAGRPVVLMPAPGGGGIHAVRLDAQVDASSVDLVPLPGTVPAELEPLSTRRSRILCKLRRGR